MQNPSSAIKKDRIFINIFPLIISVICFLIIENLVGNKKILGSDVGLVIR